MRYMDLEDEGAEVFGASDVEHLTWKNLLDGYSCTQCGRCTAACPAKVINIASIDGIAVNPLETYSYAASKAAASMSWPDWQ